MTKKTEININEPIGKVDRNKYILDEINAKITILTQTLLYRSEFWAQNNRSERECSRNKILKENRRKNKNWQNKNVLYWERLTIKSIKTQRQLEWLGHMYAQNDRW